MKSLLEYINENLSQTLIFESFSSKKLTEMAKKHGKVELESCIAMFGHYKDDKTDAKMGSVFGSIIPYLNDDEFLTSFEKFKDAEENGNEMIKWFKENVNDKYFSNFAGVAKKIYDITAYVEFLQEILRHGYFWVLFKDGAIALFRITDDKRKKELDSKISEIFNKIKNGRGKGLSKDAEVNSVNNGVKYLNAQLKTYFEDLIKKIGTKDENVLEDKIYRIFASKHKAIRQLYVRKNGEGDKSTDEEFQKQMLSGLMGKQSSIFRILTTNGVKEDKALEMLNKIAHQFVKNYSWAGKFS